MSVNPGEFAAGNTAGASHDSIWHRLHTEREDICEALLKESGNKTAARSRTPNDDGLRWHLGLFQSRLTKIDDALDRLMAGSYGNCRKCGKWIEDTKLNFDPAIAYCLSCWDRIKVSN